MKDALLLSRKVRKRTFAFARIRARSFQRRHVDYAANGPWWKPNLQKLIRHVYRDPREKPLQHLSKSIRRTYFGIHHVAILLPSAAYAATIDERRDFQIQYPRRGVLLLNLVVARAAIA